MSELRRVRFPKSVGTATVALDDIARDDDERCHETECMLILGHLGMHRSWMTPR